MGCDIHFYVERRKAGHWVTADTWEPDGDEPGSVHVPWEKAFYGTRNYNLFAILANVRNGSGFAGVKTGEGFVPISEPRGVPEDACPEYKTEVTRWSGDGHSHSWLTVHEIMDFDWTQTTIIHGVVNLENWVRWKTSRKPSEWSGAIWGNNTKTIGEPEFSSAVNDILAGEPVHKLMWRQEPLRERAEVELSGIYTRVSWEVPYYEAGREFLGETLPRLWRLGCPEDVRIVFFFDN